MEVEVKLRLPNANAHAQVAEALKTSHRETHQQENYFFDGAGKQLSSRRVVLRLRFYDHDKRAVLTIKGKQTLKDGVGIATEEEDDVDPVLARTFLAEPNKLLSLDLPLMQDVARRYELQQMVSLGGFRNTRHEFIWEGLLLELDETSYDWGTLYEIEVETATPETVREVLEAFLTSRSIPYKYTTSSKFANFINKTLL